MKLKIINSKDDADEIAKVWLEYDSEANIDIHVQVGENDQIVAYLAEDMTLNRVSNSIVSFGG